MDYTELVDSSPVPLPLKLPLMMKSQIVIDAAAADHARASNAVSMTEEKERERERELRNFPDYALQRWRGRCAHRLRWKRRSRRGAVHCAAGPCAGEGQ